MKAGLARGAALLHEAWPMDAPTSPLDFIRPTMREAAASGIVEVFNYGRGRQGLIPLWVGEGDLSSPGVISGAAKPSLAAGETFYTAQRGIPELRAAIAAYMTRVYGAAPGGADYSPENFFVTVGGMHAIEIATRLVAGPGDEVLIPSPAWPNFVDAGDLSQFAGQSDRLRRDPRRDRRNPRHRAPLWPLDRRRRDLRPHHLRWAPRALVPRRDGAGRQDHVRADPVEELGDDGVSRRLARGACRARRCDRESRSVHDLGRPGLHPEGGGCGAQRRGGVPCRANRALPPLPRHPVRPAGPDRARALP